MNVVNKGIFLIVILGLSTLIFVDPIYAEWVSPTGYNDPGAQWTQEPFAYDDNTNTYASNNYGGTGWGQFIELTLSSPIYCNYVRVNADFGYGIVDSVDIDIYADGSWVDKYVGEIDDCAWTEIEFVGENNVTAARFRFRYVVGGYYFWLYEFDFWQGAPATTPSCQTNSATSVEETTAILHGHVTDDGGEPCEFRFQYGLTDSYGTDTPWEGSMVTGDTFGKLITGLVEGNTYHFRAQVRNSVGVDSGADMTFFTGSPPSGWVSPTGDNDPDNRWENETNAYDDELSTYARSYHEINDPAGQWSSFLYLTHNAITSDRIRFYARGPTLDPYHVDSVDVDVYRNGVWTDVYQGSFADKQWVEHNFAQGTVSQARIRFYINSNSAGLYFELYEFDFYRISLNAPTLSWTGETNYESDGLDPEVGYASTNFVYRVEYTDADNDGPTWIKVYVDKNGDGDYIDPGEELDLWVATDCAPEKRDGDFTNGEIYTITINIPYGPQTDSCSYYFGANDGTYDATGIGTPPVPTDASGAINAPDVLQTLSISVSVSDSTFTFGTNPLNTWLTPQTSVITNDGTVAENFVGRISQFTDGSDTWGISPTTNGNNIIRAQWSTTSETGPWNDISAYNTDFTIATNVAVNNNVNFWFRIQTPTATSSFNQYSSTLTVTAQEY